MYHSLPPVSRMKCTNKMSIVRTDLKFFEKNLQDISLARVRVEEARRELVSIKAMIVFFSGVVPFVMFLCL